MSTKTTVGIIGCGNISSIYLQNCARFKNFKVHAVADIDLQHAKAQAGKFKVPHVLSVDELLENEEIDVVLNLTIPSAHGDVALKALQHGKSVYNEKPLALRRRQARHMLSLAHDQSIRVGGAPDTFLGGALQQCRKLIDSGAIGEPIAATAFMMGPGPEGWHPHPEFFYKKGAGPLFDMGPYYFTALTLLLGPVQRVNASARISFKEREITSKPLHGKMIQVDVPTHVSSTLEFASGVLATVVMSFDVCGRHGHSPIEIYGSEGTLLVPDPNGFGGAVSLSSRGKTEWKDIPLEFGYTENARGVGLADMIEGIRQGRRHRASGELAYHVLDIMHSIYDAADAMEHVSLQSTMERPEPMKPGLKFGQL